MRWWILVMMCFVNLICYLDRGILGVLAPEVSKEFHLSKTAMGLALACFTWTYALGQVPSGWLGDRFGPKKVLTILMCGVGLTPFLNGIATGLVSLVFARLLLGLAESGAFALTARGMQMWFARAERGRIQGISHGCGRIGAAVTPGLAAIIMLAFGWRAMFFCCGTFGFLWGDRFQLLLPQQSGRAQERQPSGAGPHPRLEPGRKYQGIRGTGAAPGSLAQHSQLVQHVVHSLGLLLLFFLYQFLHDVVPNIPARISPHVA